MSVYAQLRTFGGAAYYIGMKPLPLTNAEQKARLAPVRTWVALSIVGLASTLLRNGIYGVPFFPIRAGATLFLCLTALGALYAGSVMLWLAVRRRYDRSPHTSGHALSPNVRRSCTASPCLKPAFHSALVDGDLKNPAIAVAGRNRCHARSRMLAT